MKVGDVGWDYFDIKRSKTKAGERRIWLPKHLINGLHFRCSDLSKSDYVLFKDVQPSTEFKRSQSITVRLNYVLCKMFPEHKVVGRRQRLKTLHGLRKLMTQTAESQGVMPHIFSAMLGWSRGSIGLDVYSKPDPEMVKEGFAKVHAKFDEELKGV